MPLPARLGRTVLPVALASLALVVPALPMPPAAAATPVAGETNAFSYIAATGSGCTTQEDHDLNQPQAYSGTGRIQVSSFVDGTVTQDSDTSQSATVHSAVDGTHTTVVSGGEVRSIGLVGGITSSLDTTFTAASACQVLVQNSLSSDGTVTVARPGWATLRVQLDDAEGEVSASLRRDAADLLTRAALSGTRGVSTLRTFLTPGTYDLLMRMEVPRQSATANRPAIVGSVSTTMRASYAFTLAGAALGPTRGIGALRATLDPSVGCSLGRLGVRWKAPAARAKVATIKVNGKVLRTVRNPRAGGRVVVSVPLTRPNTVVVTVGGKTATRTYEACR